MLLQDYFHLIAYTLDYTQTTNQIKSNLPTPSMRIFHVRVNKVKRHISLFSLKISFIYYFFFHSCRNNFLSKMTHPVVNFHSSNFTNSINIKCKQEQT